MPWKTDDAGEPLYPVITRAGLEAIGVEEPSPELREWAERQPTRIGELSMAEAQAMVDAANGAAEAVPEPAEDPGAAAAAAEPPEVAQEPARRTSRAAGIARRLATARGALEAVCSHWAETARLDEALLASCRATMAELQRADAELAAEAPAPGAGGEPREGTKQARLIEMLRRPEGATIAQIADTTGWQPHTVRGAIAGALKKKLGLNVTSDKPENGGDRVYRVG